MDHAETRAFDTTTRLRTALAKADPKLPAAQLLQQLVDAGLDALPLPGRGATWQRWCALAAVAEHDLSLAKLYEGHTDALAILAELGDPAAQAVPHATWGVWAAEAPGGRSTITATQGNTVVLNGAKHWCSGAATASHVLLTTWYAAAPERGPQLVRMAVQQPGVRVVAEGWQAVGMAGSASLDVELHGAQGTLVGSAGAYLRRPGFWHGGAGVAACWYGGTVALANTLRRNLLQTPVAQRSPLRMAALGQVDLALSGTAALLREAAALIDAQPRADALALALRVRLSADSCARLVLDVVGRALGAGPFCRDAAFARMAADLPVFIRQCHAERDFAALAAQLLDGAAAAPVAAAPIAVAPGAAAGSVATVPGAVVVGTAVAATAVAGNAAAGVAVSGVAASGTTVSGTPALGAAAVPTAAAWRLT